MSTSYTKQDIEWFDVEVKESLESEVIENIITPSFSPAIMIKELP